MNRIANKLLIASLICAGLGAVSTTAAYAGEETLPEVSSSVWEEGNAQCASVLLNGKELIAFHGPNNNRSAEQRAEDLADKLQDLIQSDKFDPDKVVPAREGETATVKVDGSTLFKLEASTDANTPSSLEQIFKIANTIRTACGGSALPATFMKVAELGCTSLTAMKPGKGCFSGAASWYGPRFHGRKTSDGSRFDMNKLTAAHRWLPFGTKLLVFNRKTGASCVVKVNDRGPFVGNRVIDLSKGAAQELKMLGTGVAMVDCLVLGN